MIKVCKFGGSSMADKNCIEQVADIIRSEKERKYIVVSAPGKRFSEDIKVTDLLYKSFDERTEKKQTAFPLIRKRFVEIVDELGIELDIEKKLDEIFVNIKNSTTADYAASRGEYLSAIILAKYLGVDFIDPADIVMFSNEGRFESEYTNDLVEKKLALSERAVIAGFYGSKPNGEIKTFSRGGSDIIGSIIARGAKAEIYENWTDVNGFMTTDPRIVKNPKHIDILTYEELRELAYMGASVLHPESVFPLQINKIPINIRNTFEPENKGTMIVHSIKEKRDRRVTGIAGKKGYSIILIKKSMMNNEIGFARKVLSVLEHNKISLEHVPTGIDTMSVVVATSELENGKKQKILDEIRGKVDPDVLEVSNNLGLIAIVGQGMAYQRGTAARIFNALYKAEINVRMIDQGSSEINVIIGVEDKDLEKSIKAIYSAFFD